MFKTMNVVYVQVKQWEAAKQFYTDVLGWPLDYGDDQVGWYEWGRQGETHFAINRWDRDEPLPTAGATPVLSVDDAYAATEALRARGVTCEDVVRIPDMVTFGTFLDPDGNRVQFASSAA